MKNIAIFVLFGFLCQTLAQPTRLVYNVNDQYSFNVDANVDAAGNMVTTQQRTSGSFTNIQGTLVIQCTDQDANSNLFVFNLFDTTFNLGQGQNTNYSDFESGALGEDMYYQQGVNGTIEQIWYESDDDPYLVNIRIGVIQAFHTYLLPINQNAVIEDFDPVAVHNSKVAGSGINNIPQGLTVSKAFTQDDVIHFVDSHLHPYNVQLQSTTTTQIHPSGYILGGSQVQLVNFVNIDKKKTSSKSALNPEDSNPAYNSQLSSLGNLQVTLSQKSLAHDNVAKIRNFTNAKDFGKLGEELTYFHGNGYQVSKMLIHHKRGMGPVIPHHRKHKSSLLNLEEISVKTPRKTAEEEIAGSLFKVLFSDGDSIRDSRRYSLLEKISHKLNYEFEAGDSIRVENFLKKLLPFTKKRILGGKSSLEEETKKQLSFFLYFLGSLKSEFSMNFLLDQFLLHPTLSELRIHGSFALSAIRFPALSFIQKIEALIFEPFNKDKNANSFSNLNECWKQSDFEKTNKFHVPTSLLIQLGVLLNKFEPKNKQEENQVQEIAENIYKHFSVALKQSLKENNFNQIPLETKAGKLSELSVSDYLHAMGNAGLKFFPLNSFTRKPEILTLLSHKKLSLKKTTIQTIARMIERDQDNNGNFEEISQKESEFWVNMKRLIIQNKFPEDFDLFACSKMSDLKLNNYMLSDSNFPFNWTWSDSFSLGGHVVGLDVYAILFAGTNFNCNEPFFNYEGLATVNGTATLFGYTGNAFEALAEYGRLNGNPLLDEMYLTVWGYIIYQTTFPVIDCSVHTYPIASVYPGISASYTLWVTIVPITFDASVQLALDLSWGYQFCDSTLLLMIELLPTATLTVSGDAEIDLYIIKAGISLAGDFNQAIIPQAFIHGVQCQMGFDVQHQSLAMQVELYLYYDYQSCTLFFFDCKWEQGWQDVLYDWAQQPVDVVIFQKTWNIQP